MLTSVDSILIFTGIMEIRSSSRFLQTTTATQSSCRRESAAQDNHKFFSRDFDLYQKQRRSNNFRRAKSTEWDKEGPQVENVESKKNEKYVNPGPYTRAGYKGQEKIPKDFHMGTARRPAMKTLDKKISVSSDHLDTLTSEQREEKFLQLKSRFPMYPRASYRLPTHASDLRDGDVLFKYKGAMHSKNQYFFGYTNPPRYSEPRHPSNYLSVDEHEQDKKTPFQMFLEDDGPYSRKLYGPVKQSDNEHEQERQPHDILFIKDFMYKSKSYFPLVRYFYSFSREFYCQVGYSSKLR